MKKKARGLDMEVDIVASSLQKSLFTAELKAKGVHFFELSGHALNFPQNSRMFRRLLRERQYAVTLTVPVTAFRNGYQYHCVVSGAGGCVTSDAATLTVT